MVKLEPYHVEAIRVLVAPDCKARTSVVDEAHV